LKCFFTEGGAKAEVDYMKLGVEVMDDEDDVSDGDGDLGEEVLKLTSSGFRSKAQTVSFMISQASVQVGCCSCLFLLFKWPIVYQLVFFRM
jgi:hypothetical protein